MRRSPVPEVRPPDEATDRLLMAAILAVLGVTALLWVVGQVAAVLFGAHHWLKIGLGEMAAVPLHLIHHPGDPALAWPARVRGQLPGPVGMYAALVLVLSLPAVVFGLVAGNHFGHDRKLRERGATWATRWNLRHLIVLAPRPGRITLGRRGGWRGRLLLAVESCHSVLCFGPPVIFSRPGVRPVDQQRCVVDEVLDATREGYVEGWSGDAGVIELMPFLRAKGADEPTVVDRD